ncbi:MULTISPECIES: hypothetical protein [unclassified Amycolatopsis]|uniref:hypothetical protein n=1 Tax=unclassified Amycolatopsis TaxID=2618356 RepID=UPI002876AAFB|nr:MULTISPECIES: hypothetical protein [unclassified Amycolatopsis]MDS0132739.1 hypothetical protein [Amycolatopsis sp. 505]MDS0142436.1 hypothetical protein [Amycolatopsis sp. CM201R]
MTRARSGDDRFRDDRSVRERVKHLRDEERTYRGHAFRRHVDVGPAETRARAQRALVDNPGGRAHFRSNATRWTHETHLARAVGGVERSQEYRRSMAEAEAALRRGQPPQTVRPVVRIPLRQAIGADWSRAVAGHTADRNGVRMTRFTPQAQVVAVYRARPGGGWYLHTCYPTP